MGQENKEQISALSEEKKSQGNTAEATRVNHPRQTLSSLYRDFRVSGLSKLDSAFNALYICQSNKMCFRNIDTDDVGDGFFSHPAGWYKSGREKVRRAAKTRTLRVLELMAKMIAPFTSSVEFTVKKVHFFGDNSMEALTRAFSSMKRVLPAIAVAALSVVLLVTVYNHNEKDTVIEVSIDGVKVAEVSSPKTVELALDRVNSRITSITGEVFSFPHTLSFKSVTTDAPSTLDTNEMCDVLYSYTDHLITEAYGLYVDSELIAVLNSRADIVSVFEAIRNEHMELTGEEEDINNRIEVKYQEYARDDVIDREALLEKFSTGKEETATLKEETPATTALLSSGAISTTLTIDAEASAIEEKIAEAIGNAESEKEDAIELDFAVYYEKTVREAVPFTTKYVKDDFYYEGQEFVQKSGRDGLANNTYKVKYVNGVEDSRELISQSFIRLPRECVIKIGTRRLPEMMTEEENSGRYMINPVPEAYVSDHFGYRVLKGRGDYHEGLDLAAMDGTSIFAAASGEVIYSGYNSSYGYVVKILHSDGRISLYAHCSKLLVSVGDEVKQGDEIARVGSTGYSYGSHCHFEVIEDGVKVDPEDFIYSLD